MKKKKVPAQSTLAGAENALAAYLELISGQGKSRDRITAVRRDVKRFYTYLNEAGVFSLTEVKRTDVEGFLERLYAEEKGFSSSYRLLIYYNIKTFFTRQKRLGNLLQNPCDHVQIPKREKRLPRHVPTDREVRALINSIPQERYRDRALVELLYRSGIRRSEVANLGVEDLDFDRRLIKVKDVKSLKERMAPLSDLSRYALLEYLQKERPLLCRATAGRNQYYEEQKAQEEREKSLFLSSGGRRMSSALINRVVVKYRRIAGLKKQITAHSLRHACATEMLKGGAGIRWVQKMLGHEQIKTTMIYTKVGIEDLKKFVDKIHPHGKGGNDET